MTFATVKEKVALHNLLQKFCLHNKYEYFFTSPSVESNELTFTYSRNGFGVTQGSKGDLEIIFPSIEMRNAVFSALGLYSNQYANKNDNLCSIKFDKQFLTVSNNVATSENENIDVAQHEVINFIAKIDTEAEKLRIEQWKIHPSDDGSTVTIPKTRIGRETPTPGYIAKQPQINFTFATAEDADAFYKLYYELEAAGKWMKPLQSRLLKKDNNRVYFIHQVSIPSEEDLVDNCFNDMDNECGIYQITHAVLEAFTDNIFPSLRTPTGSGKIRKDWPEYKKNLNIMRTP